MNANQIYISTIDSNYSRLANQYGFGVEIAQFCTAWEIDSNFEKTDKEIRENIADIPNRIYHAPFNELFPCAIDPLARQLAAYRYKQAIELAKGYGAAKVVIHAGYHPKIYYPVWYTEQSVVFWKEFLKENADMEIVLENVLETEPQMWLDIVKGVDNPNFKLCMDIGHINTYSDIPLEHWLEICVPYISHFHIHNNGKSHDTHNGLIDGSIDMKSFLQKADKLCPGATYTLEVINCKTSAKWLFEEILK